MIKANLQKLSDAKSFKIIFDKIRWTKEGEFELISFKFFLFKLFFLLKFSEIARAICQAKNQRKNPVKKSKRKWAFEEFDMFSKQRKSNEILKPIPRLQVKFLDSLQPIPAVLRKSLPKTSYIPFG